MDTALYKCLLLLLLLLQIKENHQENLCTAVLLIIALRKTFFSFLTKVIFIEGAFKNIQGLQWKIQGLFKTSANDAKLDDDG